MADIDPYLLHLLADEDRNETSTLTCFPLLVQLSDLSWSPVGVPDCEVSSQIKDVVALRGTRRTIEALSADNRVLRIEGGRELPRKKKRLAIATPSADPPPLNPSPPPEPEELVAVAAASGGRSRKQMALAAAVVALVTPIAIYAFNQSIRMGNSGLQAAGSSGKTVAVVSPRKEELLKEFEQIQSRALQESLKSIGPTAAVTTSHSIQVSPENNTNIVIQHALHTGSISNVQNNEVTIDLGKKDGLQLGDSFNVSRNDNKIGSIVVRTVAESSSKAEILSTGVGLCVGDVVKKKPESSWLAAGEKKHKGSE